MIEQKEEAYKGPFWRSNGAIFIVLKSLVEAERVLNKMLREQRIVDSKLASFYAKYPPEVDVSDSEEAMEEFGDICERLWELEADLSCCTRTAILMAIIELESSVNIGLDPFERSNGRWMSLVPFLVMLLMKLAASPGWVSRAVRSLHSIGPRPRKTVEEANRCPPEVL